MFISRDPEHSHKHDGFVTGCRSLEEGVRDCHVCVFVREIVWGRVCVCVCVCVCVWWCVVCVYAGSAGRMVTEGNLCVSQSSLHIITPLPANNTAMPSRSSSMSFPHHYYAHLA